MAMREALLDSGYLTNAAINGFAPTNSILRAQVTGRLRKAFNGRADWEYTIRTNTIVVTCRPQDVPLCQHALQN